MAAPLSGSSAPQLPELVTNPLASVSAAPCVISVGRETVEVPALNAAGWLELLIGDLDLELIFPGLLEEDDQDFVNEMLLTGDLGVGDLERRALDVIAEASGRPWWVAIRMVQLAQHNWSMLGGRLARSGVNPSQVPFGAWLDALWVTMFENLAQEKWTELVSAIEAVPPSEMPEDLMESMEMDTGMFSQFMNE